jgi:hypothetical protein
VLEFKNKTKCFNVTVKTHQQCINISIYIYIYISINTNINTLLCFDDNFNTFCCILKA